MADRYLVAVTTPNYVRKASRWLSTVALIRSAKVVVVLLDFTPVTDPDGKIEAALREAFPWIEFRHMELPESHSNYMVQHGAFLTAFPDVADDALICLTDMDIEIQRDFTEMEWGYFEGLGPYQLSATWNGGPNDNLLREGERIGLDGEWLKPFDGYDPVTIPVMNCGVLIGRVLAYRELQEHYERFSEEFYTKTSHRCRCQWLINFVVDRMTGGWSRLPEAVHVHYHFRFENGDYLLPPGTEQRWHIVTENSVPAVFVHNHPRPRQHPVLEAK